MVAVIVAEVSVERLRIVEERLDIRASISVVARRNGAALNLQLAAGVCSKREFCGGGRRSRQQQQDRRADGGTISGSAPPSSTSRPGPASSAMSALSSFNWQRSWSQARWPRHPRRSPPIASAAAMHVTVDQTKTEQKQPNSCVRRALRQGHCASMASKLGPM